MEKSSKRGKIPQSDWPSIMARYEAGETLSSIARTYDCSPPAISYVVSRSRARQPGHGQPGHGQPGHGQPRHVQPGPGITAHETPPVSPGATQLIKASANGADHREPPAQSPTEPPQSTLVRRPPEAQTEHHSDSRSAHGNGHGNGFERPHWPAREQHASEPRAADLFSRSPSPSAARPHEPQPPHHAAPHTPANGDQRSRLHLQLGNGSHSNAGAHPGEPRHADRPEAQAQQHHASGGGERPAWAVPSPPHQLAPVEPQHHRPAPPNHHVSPPQYGNGHSGNGGHTEPRKENSGSFIDSELRTRVEADITAFLTAFDAALAQDTPESRAGLREATDRLLRAGARTRIELERLEARMPMPARDSGRSHEAAWRQR